MAALENVCFKFDLNGRNYIVTGGAQGIGFAVMRAICEMGGNVAVLDIQQALSQSFIHLSRSLGSKPYIFRQMLEMRRALTEHSPQL